MKTKALGALALSFLVLCTSSVALSQELPGDGLPKVPVVDCDDPGAYQAPGSAPEPADPLKTLACRAKGEHVEGGPTPQPAPFEPEGEHPSPASDHGGNSPGEEGGDPDETDTPTPNRPWTQTNGAMSGIQTADGFSGQYGVYAALNVADARVPRNSSQYLSQRVLAKSCDRGDWLEIGWVEAGWRDNKQYIYTHDTQGEWTFYDQYPLTPGQRIYVQVSQVLSDPGVWQVYLWWNGWQLLREVYSSDWLGCGGEVMVDRYQTGQGTWFNTNGPIYLGDSSSSGVQVMNVNTISWQSWDTTFPTAGYTGSTWCGDLQSTFYQRWYWGYTQSNNCAPDTRLSVTPWSGSRATDFQATLSGTTDWNGDPVSSLRIDWGDGTSSYPASTGGVVTHRYANAGSYQVRGYACDDLGACAYSSARSVHVDTANSAPVINFNVTPTSGDRTTVFNASFSGTYDPENDAMNFRIDWGDGTIDYSQSAWHRYQNAGTYAVTGRACDSFGFCSTSTRTVTVEFSNEPPTAHLTVSPTTGDLRTTFSANLNGSDPEGDPLTYEIHWGDGSTTNGQSGTHQYQEPGRYTVEGIVRDSHGGTGSSTRDVTVCAFYEQGQCAESPPRQDPPVSGPPAPVVGPLADAVRATPEVNDLAPSDSNEVMILDANLLQAYARQNPDYRDRCTLGADEVCDAPGRRWRFVERIAALVSKAASTPDGMGGVAPDVLLLQEVRESQANAIANRLDDRLGFNYEVAIANPTPEISDPTAERDWCMQPEHHPLDVDQCMDDIKIKGDSAIIYNENVLDLLGTSHVDSQYDPDERCDRVLGHDVDADGDRTVAGRSGNATTWRGSRSTR